MTAIMGYKYLTAFENPTNATVQTANAVSKLCSKLLNGLKICLAPVLALHKVDSNARIKRSVYAPFSAELEIIENIGMSEFLPATSKNMAIIKQVDNTKHIIATEILCLLIDFITGMHATTFMTAYKIAYIINSTGGLDACKQKDEIDASL